MKISQVLPLIDEHESANVNEAIANKWLSEGPWAEKFLKQLKELSASKHAVFAPNGTLGLYLSILALDLPPGSEILLPSFTFFGSASSIVFAGHKPVFVDVSPSDYTMDLRDLESKISNQTSAIMAVHIYGQAAKSEALQSVASEYGLKFIEDAAQSIGVKYRGKHAGTLGDIGVISFFADKTITTGEGAVIFCQDDELFAKLRLLRNQGRPNSGTFIHESLGMNFRITDMQAAVGSAQLSKLDSIKKQRLHAYSVYENQLSHLNEIELMKVDPNSSFIPFRFPFTSSKKDHLAEVLTASGVQTRSFFYPMHLQPPLLRFSDKNRPCVNAEKLYNTGLALPIHSGMTEDKITFICDTISNAIKGL